MHYHRCVVFAALCSAVALSGGYDDNGFGPSYAVVRLYDSGELVAKFGEKYLQETFSFWHVAKFTGYPTESVETIDETFEEMPNRGE